MSAVLESNQQHSDLTIAGQLAQFALGFDLPQAPAEVLDHAKNCILDACGIALASGTFEFAKAATNGITALADTRIGERTIRRGEGVLIALPSANRDGAAFDEPDALDITRQARSHLAFSYGTHQCLGQSLARRELVLVYRSLFTRVPALELVDSDAEFDLKERSRVHGFNSLRVTW